MNFGLLAGIVLLVFVVFCCVCFCLGRKVAAKSLKIEHSKPPVCTEDPEDYDEMTTPISLPTSHSGSPKLPKPERHSPIRSNRQSPITRKPPMPLPTPEGGNEDYDEMTTVNTLGSTRGMIKTTHTKLAQTNAGFSRSMPLPAPQEGNEDYDEMTPSTALGSTKGKVKTAHTKMAKTNSGFSKSMPFPTQKEANEDNYEMTTPNALGRTQGLIKTSHKNLARTNSGLSRSNSSLAKTKYKDIRQSSTELERSKSRHVQRALKSCLGLKLGCECRFIQTLCA